MDGWPMREPPHDFKVEQAVLGSMLLDERVCSHAVEQLRGVYFTDQLHVDLFNAIAKQRACGEPVSALTVQKHLPADSLRSVGNGYFASLLNVSVAAPEAAQLGKRLAELYACRRLNEIAASATDSARGGDDPLSAAQAALAELAGTGNTSRISASPYQWIDPKTIAPRQWLHARHFIRKYLSVTAAASGVGKSSIVLVDAVSMASGRDLLTGKGILPRKVWYWNLEDPAEELQRRVQAIALHYGLTADAFGDRLYLDSGRSQPFCIARDDRRTGVVVNKALVESVTRNIVQRGIDVLILDPFVSTHAVVENDNGSIDTVAKTLAGIADAANCAVEVVHHVRKGNGGTEVTVDDARGAGALIAAARSARIINPMTQDEAAKADIEPTARRLYFRVDNGKASMAPPGDQANWRQIVSVGLDNGVEDYPQDSVGVVTAWSWPDAFAGMTADDLKRVQNKIRGDKWRADVQAGAWAGKAVAETLGLDLEDQADKSKVKSMLKAWLKSGALVKVDRLVEETRQARPFIEVGVWAP